MRNRILLLLTITLTGCGTMIEGTSIRKESDVYGKVTDASSGKGIAGVPVSDGYTVTLTDSKGVYQLARNAKARKVFYSSPAGYEISLNPSTGIPVFFNEGILSAGKRYRVDFKLTPLKERETSWTLVAMGDPQANRKNTRRFKEETVPDLVATMSSLKKKNIYGMTLGDIIYDSNDSWEIMVDALGHIDIDGRRMPFFQTIGNHDHDSTIPAEEGDFGATHFFVDHFGPTDYSFDREGAHIVSLDNIAVKESFSESPNSNGRKWNYREHLNPEQFEWLRQDLASVKDKDRKTLFVCMHGPIRSMDNGKELLALMTGFKNAHILSAHTHSQENYVYDKYRCLSGNPIYEHVQATACGTFWDTDTDVIGSPFGYTVFDISADGVVNWTSKGVHRDISQQLRVYDGNADYSGKKNVRTDWTTPVQKMPGEKKWDTLYGFPDFKDCLIAEVWDGDSEYWRLELWQDGRKVGDFKKAPDKKVANACYIAYIYNERNRKTRRCIYNGNHYWYFKPSVKPSELRNWEVRAIQRIPDSGKTNEYRCSKITSDYTDF